MKKYRNAIGVLVLGLGLAALLAGVYYKNREKPVFVPYNTFADALAQGTVASVTLTDDAQFTFTYTGDNSRYITDNPRKPSFKEELLTEGVTVVEGGGSAGVDLLQTGLSIVVIAGAFFFVQRRNGRLFMKSAVAFCPVNGAGATDKRYGFDDVAGNTEAKESVADVVDFLTQPQKYARYGARMPRGIIFHGLPGTGKTLMAKAIAGEAGVPFFAVSGSDFVQMYVGVGASRVRELFKKAREAGKAVIFIDEIDALGKKRGDAQYGVNDERDQTLNALLTEMSGFHDDEGIMVVAATNRLDTLDEALLRPGRFDRQVEIGMPDVNARKQILALHAKNKPLAKTVDLDKLARDTVYFSGAMLESLLNEGAIYAAKRGAEAIEAEDFDKAYYTTVAGYEKKDRSHVRAEERKVTAYHESGHALVAKLAAPENTVSKVTIIPSASGAGGFCVNIPPERMYATKRALERQIMVHLGGRCAEALIFGAEEVTTGAVNDIEKATETAKQYVARFGMHAETGLLDMTRFRGDAAEAAVTAACRALIERLYEETRALLSANRSALEAIAQALLERETLNERELDDILAA